MVRVGEEGVCGGIVGGRVRFVRYAFSQSKNARLLNLKKDLKLGEIRPF